MDLRFEVGKIIGMYDAFSGLLEDPNHPERKVYFEVYDIVALPPYSLKDLLLLITKSGPNVFLKGCYRPVDQNESVKYVALNKNIQICGKCDQFNQIKRQLGKKIKNGKGYFNRKVERYRNKIKGNLIPVDSIVSGTHALSRVIIEKSKMEEELDVKDLNDQATLLEYNTLKEMELGPYHQKSAKDNVAMKEEIDVKEGPSKEEYVETIIKEEEYVMNSNIKVKDELNENFKEEIGVKKEEDVVEKNEEFAEGLKTGEVLKCCICRETCKRGVTTPCCGVAACRACATSKITATHTCWLEHCGRAGMKTEDLVNDMVLREAVDGFKKEGVVNEELARKIKDKRDQMNPVLIWKPSLVVPVLIKAKEEEKLQNTEKNKIFGKKFMNNFYGKTPSNEEELVQAVKEFNYYSIKVFNQNCKRYKKHILTQFCKTYGYKNFDTFGFGNFIEFCKRHGLEITEKSFQKQEGTRDSKDHSMKTTQDVQVPKLSRGGKGKMGERRGGYGAGESSAMVEGGRGDQEQGGYGYRGGWSGDGGYSGYGGSGGSQFDQRGYGGGWSSHRGSGVGWRGGSGYGGNGGGWGGDAPQGQGGYGGGKMGRGGQWGRGRGAPY